MPLPIGLIFSLSPDTRIHAINTVSAETRITGLVSVIKQSLSINGKRPWEEFGMANSFVVRRAVIDCLHRIGSADI